MSKASDYERRLHERLLLHDPVAPVELADAFLERVMAGLRRRCSDVRDDTLVTEAAIDAVLGYAQAPHRFDPERMGLLEYLVMSARGDLLNALERESAATRKAVPFSVVEDDPHDRNRLEEGMAVAVYDEYDLGESDRHSHVNELVMSEISDPTDREILMLMLSGERRTAEYAKALGLECCDKLESERIVKQNKDRLKKRLRRLRGAD